MWPPAGPPAVSLENPRRFRHGETPPTSHRHRGQEARTHQARNFALRHAYRSPLDKAVLTYANRRRKAA
ncbi:MAG: hypothetical protein ACK4SY_06040 [Pyrobaculum sp.]